MKKNCIPLKSSNELTNSTVVIDAQNLENNNENLQPLPSKDEPQGKRMTFSQVFHIKNNDKKKEGTTEKPPKQDANVPKKPVLGCYRGQVVQSKVNSFRKPVPAKDESSATAEKPSAAVPKATKPQPTNTSCVPVKSHRASTVTAATKSVSTASQSKQLLRPPIRSHSSNAQDTLRLGIGRASAHVTIRKGSRDKELVRATPVLSSVNTSSSQEVRGSKTLSRSATAELIARPASSSSTNTKRVGKPDTSDQRRHTIAKATVVDSRSALPRETAGERR